LTIRREYVDEKRRVEKTLADGSSADFYYNHEWQLLEEREFDAESDPIESHVYVWSARYIDAPILRDTYNDEGALQTSARVYYAGDANNNATALLDSTGAVIERYVYTAYGSVTFYDSAWANTHPSSLISNPFLYCGYYFDAETGDMLARNRYYNTALATWLSRDPIAADHNLYRYCGNNPVINTDPAGLIWAVYDIPASCWKCNLVAFIMSAYASGWDTLLFNYWNAGNGGPSSGTPWELKPEQFGVFDTDGSQRASAWQLIGVKAKGLAAGLACGGTKTETFKQGKSSASSGTRMISGYEFWFDATYTVTKTCDANGCCKSISVSATCNFHASDTVDFWPLDPIKNGQWDESGMFGSMGIRITDRLVRACYPNGRGFKLTANQSETKTWSIPCGNTKPPAPDWKLPDPHGLGPF